MKVVSINRSKEAHVSYSKDTIDYMRACEKEYAKEVARELTKGYMKLLSNYND